MATAIQMSVQRTAERTSPTAAPASRLVVCSGLSVVAATLSRCSGLEWLEDVQEDVAVTRLIERAKAGKVVPPQQVEVGGFKLVRAHRADVQAEQVHRILA